MHAAHLSPVVYVHEEDVVTRDANYVFLFASFLNSIAVMIGSIPSVHFPCSGPFFLSPSAQQDADGEMRGGIGAKALRERQDGRGKEAASSSLPAVVRDYDDYDVRRAVK